MNLLSKYACYIYISLWILYGLQRILMLKGIMAQVIFVILMMMSFYACYIVNRYYHIGPFIKWLNILLVVLTIYGLIPIIGGYSFHKGAYTSNVISNYTYLQGIYISVMPIYAFYFFSLKKKLLPDNITLVFWIFLVYSFALYFQNFLKVTADTNKEDIVNNIGFQFVPLIPMLLLVKIKNIWKYILAMVIFGFIILSMKRGAILTGGVMLLLFLKQNFRVRTKQQLFYMFSLTCIAIFVMYRSVMNLYEQNAFFHKRFDMTMHGYSSNRDKLFTYFWNYFTERTSVLEFFFGHGANGTLSLYGQYAHNDWLEFAINQGVLGLILYSVYWSVFAFEWNTYKGGKEKKQVLGDIMITYFLIALFSMSFGSMPLCATLCIGYCLAMNYRKRIETIW